MALSCMARKPLSFPKKKRRKTSLILATSFDYEIADWKSTIKPNGACM